MQRHHQSPPSVQELRYKRKFRTTSTFSFPSHPKRKLKTFPYFFVEGVFLSTIEGGVICTCAKEKKKPRAGKRFLTER